LLNSTWITNISPLKQQFAINLLKGLSSYQLKLAVRRDRWHRYHVRWALPVGIVALSAFAAAADARPPLSDPVSLNIGINCQWQQRCMQAQTRAMKRALKYLKQADPSPWQLQLCNHNAARQRLRIDWVGFDNCLRNTVLRPIPAKAPARASKAPARAASKKPSRLTETAPSPPALPSAPGERG